LLNIDIFDYTRDGPYDGHVGAYLGGAGYQIVGSGEVQATYQIDPDTSEQIGDPVLLNVVPNNASGDNGSFAFDLQGITPGLQRLRIGDSFSVDVQVSVASAGPAAGDVGLTLMPIATPTVVVNPVTATYDGSPHETTGEAFGVGGVDLGPVAITYNTADGSAPVDAGTYTATGTFAGNADYTSATGTATIVIGQATSTVMVNPITTTYDGSPHGTTGEAFGAGGENLGPVAITYGSADAPIHAGTYTATGTFAGNQDYTSATGTATIAIGLATPRVTVNPIFVSYDGNVHLTTGEAIGVNGENLGPVAITYGTADGNAPVHAGTYTASGTFAGNQDYTSATGAAPIVIGQATPSVTVNSITTTYDAGPQGTTGEANGVGGADLGPVAITYNPGGGAPVDAGTYLATGTFAGNQDYASATGTAPIFIAPAMPTVTVNPVSITYDGNVHGTTGEAYGVGGMDLGPVAITYNTPDGSAPVHAGIYTATGTFAGNQDYTPASAGNEIVIGKANPTIAVSPYSVTYDGKSHIATGTATGVLGESLGGLDLTATAHSAAGAYPDTWTFTDTTGNYNNASGTVNDKIAKANATITVSPYSVTYDGKGHTATGTATGVLGEALGGLDLTGTTHSAAGAYTDTWTFTDTTGNYNNASGTVSDKIAKAPLTVSVKSYLMLAGNKPPAVSGTVVGLVNGDTVNVAYRTTATASSKAGQYVTTGTVTGASLSNYTLTVTNGTMYVVNQGADPAASGPKLLSFWDNSKNANLITVADLTALDGLNLVDNSGNAFDPTSAAQLQKWLSGASSKSNWGYQLSTQLAVAELNVLTGYTKASDLVYAGGLLPFASQYGVPGLTSGGFLSVQNLINAANTLLLQDPLGGPTDPNDSYFQALMAALQAMNGNKSFVTQELSWNLVSLYQQGLLS
jgi:hypothetical protein